MGIFDHCKALKDVRQAGINVYASQETFKSLKIGGGRRINPVENKTLIRLETFDVLCFSVEHDCPGCLGFVVRENETGEFLLFATDIAFIRQRFKHQFNIIALECSYSKEILEHRLYTDEKQLKIEGLTPIHEALAKRLLTSHMSKHNCFSYLDKFCDLTNCREIHLLHMSANNIDKKNTQIELEKRFFIKTIIKG